MKYKIIINKYLLKGKWREGESEKRLNPKRKYDDEGKKIRRIQPRLAGGYAFERHFRFASKHGNTDILADSTQ